MSRGGCSQSRAGIEDALRAGSMPPNFMLTLLFLIFSQDRQLRFQLDSSSEHPPCDMSSSENVSDAYPISYVLFWGYHPRRHSILPPCSMNETGSPSQSWETQRCNLFRSVYTASAHSVYLLQ
eukprot:gene1231-biopygen9551